MSRVRSGLSALVLMVLVALSLPAEVGGTVLEANTYPLPWAEDPSKGLADNPIIVKVIFVAFGTSPHTDPEHAAIRENMLMRCKTSFLQQSNERHNIEFEVLPVPGEPGAMWTLVPQGPSDFQFSGDFQYPYAFDRFSASWVGGSSQGELQARVMELIQLTYDAAFGVGGWTSPLANADAVLFAVAPDLGGREQFPLAINDGQLGLPYLSLRVTTVQPEIARVTNAAPSIGPNDAMLGAIVMLDPVGLGDSTRNVAAIIHYWCWILGLWDIQSVRGTLAFPNHFGAYSVTRPWLSESEADYPSRAPIIDHPSRVKLGWITPIEIAGNLRDVHLTSATSGGQIYRLPVSHTTFDIPPGFLQVRYTAVADEYFLIAYEDGAAAEYGGSDTGLFIWHCVEYTQRTKDESPDLPAGTIVAAFTNWDLEVASGLYSDPGTWSSADPVGGFDSLNNWTGRSEALYRVYNGSPDDLFDFQGVEEFSYRVSPPNNVNPSAFGYDVDAESLFAQQMFPYWPDQSVPTSIMIRITGLQPDGIVVDLLVAPFEEVLAPNGGEVLLVGQPQTITWSREFTADQLNGIIDTVDIYCNGGGSYGDELIASGVDATLGSYVWIPEAAHVGNACKVKVVCHNVNDLARVGMDESDGTFVVADLTEAKFTDVSGETGLSYSGQPHSAAPGDFHPDGKHDLLITATGGFVSMGRGALVQPSGAPYFTNTTVSNVMNGRGVAAADFDNDGDQDIFVAHATTPKLWRSHGGLYFDATSASGLASLASGSLAAAWGDYDRDGWLDLFVTRGAPISLEPPSAMNISAAQVRLFRNLGNGSFADVTEAANLSGYVNACVSPNWGDIDGDGYPDIVALDLDDPTLSTHLVFMNQGNGTFTEQFMSRLYHPGVNMYYVSGVVLEDMNNDGHLDLVYSSAGAGSSVCLNDGTGAFHGNQRILFPPIIGEVGTCYSGLLVFDHDLDGWKDVVLTSTSASAPSRSFACVPTPEGVTFLENTAAVGLGGSSKAIGAAAADFTGDGDLDLFMGRAVTDGQYFYKTDSKAGSNALGRNYVKVRLASPLKVHNWQGIGATVSVTAGDLEQTQVVDGGSGRGGQRDRDLVFGLGDYSGSVTATVKWPRGHVQSGIPLFVSGPASGDVINTVADETMVISNLNATSYVVPGTTLFDWVFSWDTNAACDTSLDVLTIDQVGIQNPCWPGWTVLTPSTPGVVYSYGPKPGGGYLHQFTIYGQECNLNCSFRYSAFSAMGANQATSTTKTKQVKFCPSGF